MSAQKPASIRPAPGPERRNPGPESPEDGRPTLDMVFHVLRPEFF